MQTHYLAMFFLQAGTSLTSGLTTAEGIALASSFNAARRASSFSFSTLHFRDIDSSPPSFLAF